MWLAGRTAQAALLVCALAEVAAADRRVFTYAWQYGTEAPGDLSLALWHTEARPAWDGSTTALGYQLQLQHGLTEHWDASVFSSFAQTASGDPARVEPFGLAEVRLLNRYRFVDRSEWPVDVQLQLDTGKRFGPSAYDLELRVVLARDLDQLALAANVAGRVSAGADIDTTRELVWNAAASYELHPVISIGVEAFGAIDAEQAAIGPVVAVAPSPRLWFAVTAGLGVTSASDDLIARALLGIEL